MATTSRASFVLYAFAMDIAGSEHFPCMKSFVTRSTKRYMEETIAVARTSFSAGQDREMHPSEVANFSFKRQWPTTDLPCTSWLLASTDPNASRSVTYLIVFSKAPWQIPTGIQATDTRDASRTLATDSAKPTVIKQTSFVVKRLYRNSTQERCSDDTYHYHPLHLHLDRKHRGIPHLRFAPCVN